MLVISRFWNATLYDRWMQVSSRNAVVLHQLTYLQYYTLSVLPNILPHMGHLEQANIADASRMYTTRRSNLPHICRLQPLRPTSGEVFYLHAILQHRRATSFLGAKTVGGLIYNIFQEAAIALHLFASRDRHAKPHKRLFNVFNTARSGISLHTC